MYRTRRCPGESAGAWAPTTIGYDGRPATTTVWTLSRSLLAFLLFCLALLLVSGALVWHVGPTLTGLVVDGERRASPYHVLRIVPGAARAVVENGGLRARLLALAAEDDGRLDWQGGDVEVIEGPVRLEGAAVQLLTFGSGGDLVQFFTSSGYRGLEADHGGSTGLYLGSAEAPGPLAGEQASVLVLYRAKGVADSAPLGVVGESGWLALVGRHGGTVRWQTPLAVLRGAGSWDRLLMLQFPHRQAALAWLRDPATATERAIAGKHVDDVVILLAQPS
jgi:uncharacterized protein (DUF1330 family)